LLAGTIVGAKALFVVLGWEHYARGELRFWADFSVGFVFFGGLLGALLAGAVFARLRRLDFMRGADYFAVAVPLGHAIGRIGCFFAGCCYGRFGHPVQLYEALGLVLIALTCRHALGRVEAGEAARGTAFRVYLGLYGALRVVLDPLRGDGRPERFLGISHQQGIALCVIALALVWQANDRSESRRARLIVLRTSSAAQVGRGPSRVARIAGHHFRESPFSLLTSLPSGSDSETDRPTSTGGTHGSISMKATRVSCAPPRAESLRGSNRGARA